MRRRSGFTLIELLVVVAIIVLLIALSLPALAGAKRQARLVQCRSQLKQIGIAWAAYLSDHTDRFPQRTTNLNWTYGGKAARYDLNYRLPIRPINPYVGEAERDSNGLEVFRCTEDGPIVSSVSRFSSPTNGHTTYDWFGNSYPLNLFLLRMEKRLPDKQIPPPVKLDEFGVNASRVVLAADAQSVYTISNSLFYSAPFHSDDDRMNIVFVDGHAQLIPLLRGVVRTEDYSFPIESLDDR